MKNLTTGVSESRWKLIIYLNGCIEDNSNFDPVYMGLANFWTEEFLTCATCLHNSGKILLKYCLHESIQIFVVGVNTGITSSSCMWLGSKNWAKTCMVQVWTRVCIKLSGTELVKNFDQLLIRSKRCPVLWAPFKQKVDPCKFLSIQKFIWTV